MKLLRVHVLSAETCGGLLDGFELWFRGPSADTLTFDPLCLVGPNGTGKSQLMQVIAEMFQAAFHKCNSSEERNETNPKLQFELEYLIRPEPESDPVHVRISRKATLNRRPRLTVQTREGLEWKDSTLQVPATRKLLPRKVVGYTSGDNETLSLPFLESRSGYAHDVRQMALDEGARSKRVTDTRLMLIDYGTHLEVLVANLLLGNISQRRALLEDALVKDLHSFRCIIQLKHPAAPKMGVQLTKELEDYVTWLQRCATCYTCDQKTQTYTYDYLITQETRKAFGYFWKSAVELYSSFHKLAMLNDLAISKSARNNVRNDAKTRRFASRLPEPQDKDKIFRFERVAFIAHQGGTEVDYISLSDGEHQLAQLLGTFCMVSFPNVLFLLDEPESHFNPYGASSFCRGFGIYQPPAECGLTRCLSHSRTAS